MEADATDPEALARDRDAALALLHEWTENEALRRHAYAVEAAVRAYARLRGGDEEAWGCVALLHDFDYERHPTHRTAPAGRRALPARGGLSGVVRARRALAREPPRRRSRDARADLEHVLFACDELAGFVHACGLVRPEGIATLEARSVRKKLKQKSFASGVDRDDVRDGAEELGVDLDAHITVVIEALRPIAAELGLPG